jgi:hypothetical protein
MAEKIRSVKVWEVDKSVINRANYWWLSALKRKHPFDKFISGWISFNVIYNFISRKNNKKDGEVERVKSTVKSLFKENSWSGDLDNSIEALIGFDVGAGIWYRKSATADDWVSAETIRKGIRQSFVEKKNVEALIKTYEIIYHVRCNLFHGDKSDDNQKDLDVVNLCWDVMKHSYPPMLKTLS